MQGKKRIILISLLCMVFFLLYLILGYVHYETNDDTGFNMIAGGNTANSEKLFFINIIFGYILKIFYSITHAINWYLWVILVINLVAMTSLCVVMSQKFEISLTVLITVIVNIAVGGQVYNGFQFMKNASFLLLVGFVVMVDSFKNEEKFVKTKFLLGIVLFLFGYMIRTDSFILLLPYFALYILATAVCRTILLRKQSIKFSVRKIIRLYIIPMIIVIVSMTVVRGVDYFALHESEEWKTYWEYHMLRSELRDRGAPDYETNKALYDSIGWDENELNLFRFWITADDAFDYDHLKAIVDAKADDAKFSFKIDEEYLDSYYANFYKKTVREFSYPYVYIVILLGVLLATNWAGVLYVIGSILVILIEYGYLVYIARVLWRVEFGMWLAMLTLLALFLFKNYSKESLVAKLIGRVSSSIEKHNESSKDDKKIDVKSILKKLIWVLAILLFVERTILLVGDFIEIKGGHLTEVTENPAADFIDYTRNDGKIYYIDNLTFDNKFRSVFDIKGDLSIFGEKYVGLGGWMVPSPVWYDNYNGDVPQIKDLYLKDNIYFVDCNNTNGYILGLLQKRYDPCIEVELVDFFEGIGVWHYYISE